MQAASTSLDSLSFSFSRMECDEICICLNTYHQHKQLIWKLHFIFTMIELGTTTFFVCCCKWFASFDELKMKETSLFISQQAKCTFLHNSSHSSIIFLSEIPFFPLKPWANMIPLDDKFSTGMPTLYSHY